MLSAGEVIKEVLRKGPRTPKELLYECCEKRDVDSSTYYRYRNRLVRLGEVKEAKYELIKRIKDADPEVIRDCIRIIKSGEPDEIRIARAEQLKRLCKLQRAIYSPGLLDFFSTFVSDQNEEVRKHLVSAFSGMVFRESKLTPLDERAMNLIADEGITPMSKIALEDSNFDIRREAIKFLGLTSDARAVDTLLKLVEDGSEVEYKKLEECIKARGMFHISEKLDKVVSRKLDKLLVHENPVVRQRAKDLHKYLVGYVYDHHLI